MLPLLKPFVIVSHDIFLPFDYRPCLRGFAQPDCVREGALLVVDAVQGVEAQTVANVDWVMDEFRFWTERLL